MIRLTPELMGQLNEFYTSLSKTPGFPRGHCVRVSRLVSSRFGLYYVIGEFLVNRSVLLPHCWNEDLSGIKVDLTAHQFKELVYPPIREGVLIINPDDPLGMRFRQSNYPGSKYLYRIE